MIRFAELVHRGETLGDVKRKYPETEAVFEKFGLGHTFYDCSMDEAARMAGTALDNLLAEINEAISISRDLTA